MKHTSFKTYRCLSDLVIITYGMDWKKNLKQNSRLNWIVIRQTAYELTTTEIKIKQ